MPMFHMPAEKVSRSPAGQSITGTQAVRTKAMLIQALKAPCAMRLRASRGDDAEISQHDREQEGGDDAGKPQEAGRARPLPKGARLRMEGREGWS